MTRCKNGFDITDNYRDTTGSCRIIHFTKKSVCGKSVKNLRLILLPLQCQKTGNFDKYHGNTLGGGALIIDNGVSRVTVHFLKAP